MADGVLQKIVTDVGDLGWGAESAGVVTVGEDFAVSLHHAVERASHADGETLHTPAERALILGLDEEVDMISLHRVMNEAKAEAIAAG
jgi:hypothetical protein